MSTTRLTTINTQEGIHPASTATTLDTQLLGSPKAPPTAQEIQRKLSVAQRTQKVCVSCYFLNLPRVLCCLHSPCSRCCLSADGIIRGTYLWEATQLPSNTWCRSGAHCALRCSGCRPFHLIRRRTAFWSAWAPLRHHIGPPILKSCLKFWLYSQHSRYWTADYTSSI